MLSEMTDAMTKNFEPDAEGSKKSQGIKAIISPILDKIIISNKSIINDVASGESCDQYYPVTCNPAGTETYQACNKDGTIGLISCDKSVRVSYVQEKKCMPVDLMLMQCAHFCFNCLGILFPNYRLDSALSSSKRVLRNPWTPHQVGLPFY